MHHIYPEFWEDASKTDPSGPQYDPRFEQIAYEFYGNPLFNAHLSKSCYKVLLKLLLMRERFTQVMLDGAAQIGDQKTMRWRLQKHIAAEFDHIGQTHHAAVAALDIIQNAPSTASYRWADKFLANGDKRACCDIGKTTSGPSRMNLACMALKIVKQHPALRQKTKELGLPDSICKRWH